MELQNQLSDLVGSLIEELDDEELATCVGGCDIAVNLLDQSVAVPLLGPLPLLGSVSAGASVDSISASTTYDPNGSARFVSDRNVKESFKEVDVQQVLEKVATLPITTWNYTQEADSVRHIGPMAQDFAATFGMGDSDRSIHAVDANGVALAAIQALYQMLQERDAELNNLKAAMQSMQQQLQVAV